jgi:hypothetical protein
VRPQLVVQEIGPLHCVVRFPTNWVNASLFDWALRNSCGPHDSSAFETTFEFPTGCKIMIEAAVRLLSLVNQLALTTRRVHLNFEDGADGTMGYLNRMGFFDHLADSVEVRPSRPAYSGAKFYRAVTRRSLRLRASIRIRGMTICQRV